MANRIATFRSPEAATRYYEMYDGIVERNWPIAHDELDVPTRFGTTHVRRTGTDRGTPIVLIHPTTGSSIGWYPLIGELADHHAVYTPDTVGTAGRSIQTRPITTPEHLSSWLDDTIDALELDLVHVVGYSEGGWIAAIHAATTRTRDRLTSLTLIEPGGAIERIPRRILATLVFKAARTLKAKDKRQALREFNRWMNGDVEMSDDLLDMFLFVFANFRQKLPTPGRLSDDQLARIDVPTLLLLAENTLLYDPTRVADKARRLLSDVGVEIIPNAGHGVAFQHPDTVTEMALRHIDAVDARGAQRS